MPDLYCTGQAAGALAQSEWEEVANFATACCSGTVCLTKTSETLENTLMTLYALLKRPISKKNIRTPLKRDKEKVSTANG